jgi:hypothetical protein
LFPESQNTFTYKMSATEIFSGGNYDVSKITVLPPIKSTDSNKYHSFPIKVGAANLGLMETQTVLATRLKDDPKLKPGILSQGFHLENPQTRKLLQDAENAIWQGLLKQKDADPDLPSYLKDAESVEDLKAASKFIKMKGLVHYPKGKDSKGKPTKQADPNMTPLVYGKLIQCGANHKETPLKVHSRYYDVAILNPSVKQAIRDGLDKMENYLIPAETLWQKKLTFKAKWCMVVGDVFVSDSVLKIRRSITEVWVVAFVTSESVGSKAMDAAIAATGEKFEATRLNIPSNVQVADEDDDEGDSGEGGFGDVQINKVPAGGVKTGGGIKMNGAPVGGPKAGEHNFDVKLDEDDHN